MRSAKVYIGFDPAEMQAWNVAHLSMRVHASARLPVERLSLMQLQHQGIYRRPTETRAGQLFDVLSDAPMSTQHALARFFIPYLMGFEGWAVFVDGDVLFRADVQDLFSLAESCYAIQCVQHPPMPEQATKKDGAVQQAYARKNWSSVMLINCAHPAWRRVTLTDLNTLPGRDLHRFCWLQDNEIGALPVGWNHLVGVSPASTDVQLAHFTLGVPTIDGHADDPFADEWFDVYRRCGYYRQVHV